MIYLTVLIKVAAEKENEFLSVVKPLIEGSIKEVGCQGYYLTKMESDQYNYILHEQWENEEALEVHRQTAHYQIGVPKLVSVTEVLLPLSGVKQEV